MSETDQKPEPLEMRACRACQMHFRPTRKWQEFCSLKCRNNYHNDKKYIGTEVPLIKCPFCNTDNTDKGMIEELGGGKFLCNCCSKEFEVNNE